MKQKIHIRVVDLGERDEVDTFLFLETAVRFGSQNVAEQQVSDWLLQGAQYFWSDLLKKSSYFFDLRHFDATSRDLVLKILKQVRTFVRRNRDEPQSLEREFCAMVTSNTASADGPATRFSS